MHFVTDNRPELASEVHPLILIKQQTENTATRQWLEESRRVVVISHMNADGDAMGSLLAFRHLLGEKSGLILPNGCPPQFRWMKGSDEIVSGDDERARCETMLAEADLIVAVDFNTPPRVDFLAEALTSSQARKVLIDHHHTPDREHFDVIVSQPQVSSACEVVYWFLVALWGDDVITQEIAQCLYTGICTDTGSFSYSSESPSVYEAAAHLVMRNIDAAEIHNRINNTFTERRMRFYGFVLSERLLVFPESRFAYIYATLDDMERFGVCAADMEGLVNYAMMLSIVDVGALLREEKSRIKVSLRSKKEVDVNMIARRHFNGGGHTKASGGHTYNTMQETRTLLESLFVKK